MAAGGEVIAACGDIDSPVFVRSAAKPLQALSLVESGAADPRWTFGALAKARSAAGAHSEEASTVRGR